MNRLHDPAQGDRGKAKEQGLREIRPRRETRPDPRGKEMQKKKKMTDDKRAETAAHTVGKSEESPPRMND